MNNKYLTITLAFFIKFLMRPFEVIFTFKKDVFIRQWHVKIIVLSLKSKIKFKLLSITYSLMITAKFWSEFDGIMMKLETFYYVLPFRLL